MFNGNDIADFYARTLTVILLLSFASGALIAVTVVYGFPWASEIIKPFLHEATR
jgi:hypothetical protein